MEKQRIIVAGSRNFNNYDYLKKICDFIIDEEDVVIISGTARGADKLGERYAKEKGFELRLFPAKWDEYGKRAGYFRNVEMAKNADMLIAFWDGESKGTKHMIDIAEKEGLASAVVQSWKNATSSQS